MNSEFLPEAIVELEEAFQFYESRAGLGSDFKAEARRTLELLMLHPEAWHPLGKGLRRCRFTRYPYALIYGVEKDRIIAIAVAALRRKPGYWIKRAQRLRR